MTDPTSLILIGIGANLGNAEFASPRATCEAAVSAIEEAGVVILRQSNWFKSAPVPASSQPWYINGVIAVETSLNPERLMSLMARIEERFGRTRGVKNAARTLDIDLIAYGDLVIGWDGDKTEGLSVPHRRMNERGFVLLPLQEIAPDWLHPVLHLSLIKMIAALDPSQRTLRDD